MRQFRGRNTCPEVAEKKHPWYALHRPRDPKIFESPKFIGLTTTKAIELVYDEKENLYVTDAMYVFTAKDGIDPWALMAVMQSMAFLFLYRVANQGESRVIPQIKAAKLETLPIPKIGDSADIKALSRSSRKLLVLNRKLEVTISDKTRTAIERIVRATEQRIEESVYKLYGLTKAEITLIEKSFEKTEDENDPKERSKAQQAALGFS